MVQKPTEAPALPQTADPAEFPLGSPESRAAARILMQEMQPPKAFVELDANGKPIYEPGKRYAQHVIMVPKKLSIEEWTERWRAWDAKSPEERKEAREKFRALMAPGRTP